eukprot:CCRYP_002907-RA/>CCRYP_002907-RA protein AED:0.33 eAED:0.33 QI:0/0/0/1/0/0/2/0/270
MPLEVYKKIPKKLFFSSEEEDVSVTYLVLDWGLMKRAENCVGAKTNHILFKDDALVFQFAKSKGNQTGDEFGPWHVYANPDAPWICPVLAFARYLFCYPDILRGGAPLFEGSNQYNRYSTRFACLLVEMKDDLNGFDPTDFGSHSTRKGVATWHCITSDCCRVPQSRMIIQWGDQYVGRCASGLAADTCNFAISRAYFDFSGLTSEEERLERRRLIAAWLQERLPGNIPSSSFELAWNCFATICYHYNYLKANLDKNCVLSNSPVFKDIP